MDVAAEKATVEPSDGRARRNDSVAASQMVLMGDRKRSSTFHVSASGSNIARLSPILSYRLSYLVEKVRKPSISAESEHHSGI